MSLGGGGFSNGMAVVSYLFFGTIAAMALAGLYFLMTLAVPTSPVPTAKVEPSRLACQHNLLFSQARDGALKQIIDENGHGIPCKTGP
jgi:hypothetical protein